VCYGVGHERGQWLAWSGGLHFRWNRFHCDDDAVLFGVISSVKGPVSVAKARREIERRLGTDVVPQYYCQYRYCPRRMEPIDPLRVVASISRGAIPRYHDAVCRSREVWQRSRERRASHARTSKPG
jgi:hypothetical protein